MKSLIRGKLLTLAIVSFALAIPHPVAATVWEFGITVTSDGNKDHTIVMTVYLYRAIDLETGFLTPYRQGDSYATGFPNFHFDINSDNDGSANWASISDGTYYLRIDNVYLKMYIPGTILEGDGDCHLLYNKATSSFDQIYFNDRPIWFEPLQPWSFQEISVTVNQFLQDNATRVGELRRWDGAGFDHLLPNGSPLKYKDGSNQAIRADQSICSNQKYNNWNSLSDVTNHHVFTVTTSTPTLTSNLRPIGTGVSISNYFIDITSAADSVEFRDPWYIDYPDPLYGSNWRNRGMQDAVSRKRSVETCGFKPDASTVYPESPNHPYRGVFLNQGSDWQPPYYSVGAPNPQTVNGFTYYFLNWTGTNVQYRDSNAAQTGVVFKQNGATATARYKAHLGSSIAAPTGGSGQRKLVEYNGYHLIYESSGEIWYTRSQDLGQTWTPEIRVSSGAGNAHNPCFAGTNSDVTYAFWVAPTQRPGASGYDIFARSVNLVDGTWSPTEVVTLPDDHNPGVARPDAKPAAAMIGEDPLVAVVFEGANTGLLSGYKLWSPSYDSYVWVRTSLTGTTTASARPSALLAYEQDCSTFYVTHDNGSQVYLSVSQPLTKHSNQIVFSSAPQQISHGGMLRNNRQSCLAADEYANLHVSWTAYVPDEYVNVIATSSRMSGVWQDIQEFSGLQSTPPTSSVGGFQFATGAVMHFTDGTYLYTQRTLDGMSWPSEGTYSYGASISSPNLQPSALPWQVSSVLALSAPPLYRIAFDVGDYSEGMFKESRDTSRVRVPALATKTKGLVVSDEQNDGYLYLCMRNVIAQSSGANAPTAVDISTASSALGGSDAVLRTKPIQATGTTGVNGQVEIRKYNWQGKGQIVLNLVDTKTGEVITRLLAQDVDRLTCSRTTMQTTAVVPAAAGSREVRLELKAEGVEPGAKRTDFVQLTRYTLPLGKPGNPEQGSGDALAALPAENGAMQNYPNPFNPSTEIRFQLTNLSHVSMKVYDMLGREVATLVEGYRMAGYHSATFNGSSFPSGVYFCRLSITPENGKPMTWTRKMVLAK